MSSRISSVPLYLHPERVEEELAAIGLGPEAELTVDQVAPFDQITITETYQLLERSGGLGWCLVVASLISALVSAARRVTWRRILVAS